MKTHGGGWVLYLLAYPALMLAIQKLGEFGHLTSKDIILVNVSGKHNFTHPKINDFSWYQYKEVLAPICILFQGRKILKSSFPVGKY